MEALPPPLMPAPPVASGGKPIVIRPPEAGSAHDLAIIGFIITFLLTLPWLIITLIVGGIGLFASPICIYLGDCVVLPPSTSVPYLQQFLLFLEAFLPLSWAAYLGVGGVGLLVGLLILGAIYFGMVRNISKGRYEKARNSSLFWAILFIIPIFAIPFSPTLLYGTVIALVPAFFFLLTYGRLGEVIAKYGPVAVMGEAVPGAPVAGVPPPMPMPGPMMPGMPLAGVPGPVPMPVGAGPMPPMMPGMSGFNGPQPNMVPPDAAHVHPPGPEMSRAPLCPTCGRELYHSVNHRRWYCMTCDNPGRM